VNVLVTGGAGYIGSVVAASLLAGGHRVVVFDSLLRGHRAAVPAGAALVRGDVRDREAVAAALQRHRCSALVHLAALAEVGESVTFPDLYHEVNALGTRAVAEAALSAGVERLVYSSTAAVYGEPATAPITESMPLRPSNPYGASKLAGERAIAEAADRSGGRLGVAILRYFNACGADGERGEDHNPETHLIPLALRAARDGRELAVFGDDYPTEDGTCVRDYVHVVDLAAAHVAALERLPAAAGAYNLGTGRGNSVLEVVAAVRRISELPLRLRFAPRRPGDPPVLVASHRLAADVLRWRPRYTLDDAIRDAWNWLCRWPNGYGEA
jgi:UDP-glucose-4-epimerase GalE